MSAARTRRLRQLLWFALLWAGGVAATAAVAYGIRLWMSAG